MRRTATRVRGGSNLSRRDFLRLGGSGLAGTALLGSGTLAGCGGGDSASGDDLILSFGPDDTGVLPGIIQDFNQQSDFKIRYREMPSDTGQYFDKLRTEFQAGGDIDIIVGDVIWPAQFAATGYVTDLTDRFTDSDQFLPGPMEAVTYDDKLWAVPWYTDAGLLYYRSDLLESAGFSEAPATWDELNEMAGKIQQDEGLRGGFVFQGAEYEGGVCNGCEYIRTNGGDILDPEDPSRVIIDSPEAAAGLETWAGMIQDGASPQAVLQYQEDESHAAFLNGDAAFIRIWPYMYALIGSEDFPSLEPGQVGITQIPVAEGQTQSSSTLGGWNFLINAASDKQDEAWEFIQYMTAPEQLKRNALEGSKLPTREALYEDQEILDNVPVARLGQEAIINNSDPRPVSPYYSDMSLELAEQFNATLAGDTSPQSAVNTLQTSLQQIVEQGQDLN